MTTLSKPWKQWSGCLVLAGTLMGATPAGAGVLSWYASTTNNQSLPSQIASDGLDQTVVYNAVTNLSAAQTFLDRAQAAGVRVVLDTGRIYDTPADLSALELYVDTFKNHPALAGWYVFDEPNETGISVAEAQSAYNIVRARSPLPIYGAIDADRPSSQNDYMGVLDHLITFDYPFNVGDAEFEGLENTFFGLVPGWKKYTADSANRARAAGKGWSNAIQAYGQDAGSPDLRLPTARELRFMTYYSLVAHDADSVMFWARYRTDRSDALAGQPYPHDGVAWRTQVFMPMAGEFEDYFGNAVEAGALASAVASSRPSDVFADVYFDSQTGKYYLLVVHDENASVTSTLTLSVPGIGFDQAIRLDGAGTLAISGNTFTVSMGAYGTAAYELRPIPEPASVGLLLLLGWCCRRAARAG